MVTSCVVCAAFGGSASAGEMRAGICRRVLVPGARGAHPEGVRASMQQHPPAAHLRHESVPAQLASQDLRARQGDGIHRLPALLRECDRLVECRLVRYGVLLMQDSTSGRTIGRA